MVALLLLLQKSCAARRKQKKHNSLGFQSFEEESCVDDSGGGGDLGESPTLEEFGDELAAILRSDPLMPELPTPLARELRQVQSSSAGACE